MRPTIGRSACAPTLALAALLTGLPASGQQERAAPAKGPSHRVVQPPAPDLPGTVIAAIQAGEFGPAGAAIDALMAGAKDEATRSYLALVRGVVHKLDGKADRAIALWSEGLKRDPKGTWAHKIAYELATAELAAGRAAPAEALVRVEAEELLAPDRKDRLAGVYAALARRLLSPDQPFQTADPKAAYELLDRARLLAKGDALRSRLRFEMGEAASKAGMHAEAIAAYRAYLTDPKPARPFEARFAIGEQESGMNQAAAARLTWLDLVAEIEKAPRPLAAEVDEVRARALFQLAIGQGLPTPADDAALAVGVAGLRRFLAAYPAHPLAVRAAFLIGGSYASRGQTDEAIAAYRRFNAGTDYRAETDEARRTLAADLMSATFEVARLLAGQEKFAEAIDAWQGYLAKFPDGPQSADAQRAILDARLAGAADARRRGKPAEARAAWAAFVAANPLDPRVPQVLFDAGESHLDEGKADEAIAAWAPLLSRFAGTEPAGHAQFVIASLFEERKGDPAGAIERFRQVAVEPWKGQAAGRVAVMESCQLAVITPRAFRSGETPHLKVTSRNLETLTFAAYKISPEAYFRKKHAVSGVESLDIGLVAADAEWTVPVADYARFRPVETTYDLKVNVPGVWVVKVSDEKHLQATTLVIGSDVDAILKSSRDQLLVFAQDMKTGKGRPKARVLVADGSGVFLDKTTGDDGVLLADWGTPRDLNSGLSYLVLDGGDAAGTGLAIPGQVAQGLSARAYLDTDRPAYRPGQTVSIRGVVREVDRGGYVSPAGAGYLLDVLDANGRQIVHRPVTLSTFGTFHEALTLDSAAPEGDYRVHVYQPEKSSFDGKFAVRSYQLEKLAVSIELPRTVVFRGETIKGEVVARYGYGGPAAGRPVLVLLPDGRRVSGLTDDAGKFPIEFGTGSFAEETTLPIVAQLTRDNVNTEASVALAVRAFRIGLTTRRETYLDGEPFAFGVNTSDPLGKPTGEALTLAVLKRVVQGGRVAERQVSTRALKTDPATGAATADLKVDDPDGGGYTVRVSGTDRFGNVVFADHLLTISGKADETKLRFLADRLDYRVGETATLRLHSRVATGPGLVTWEADRVIRHRIVALNEGENAISWPVDGSDFPNVSLAVARMSGTRFDEATVGLTIARELKVAVRPAKPSLGPNDEVSVTVETTDGLGKPVAAEVSLALVDRALLRLVGDATPPIGPYFYGQTRLGAFSTTSTNTFRYASTTVPVSDAVVEEADRQAQLARNEVAQRGFLESMASADRAGALPAPMAAAQPGMGFGGMGGGMAAGKESRLFAEKRKARGRDEMGRSRPVIDDLKVGKDLSRDTPAEIQMGEVRFGLDAAKSPAPPRERFVETAYWNPSVVTGPDGKATVTFKAPPAMSDYRFTARGVTGSDTLVGQATADLVVTKDLFVDLKVPAGFAQGDRPRPIAEVHHRGVEGPARVKLAVYAGGAEAVYPMTITLKGDGVSEVVFPGFLVPEGDSVRFTASVEAGGKADSLVVEVPSRPWGVVATATASGTSRDGATVFVGLPPGRTYDDPEMTVTIAPTLRRMIVEIALDHGGHASPWSSYRARPGRPLPLSIADRASALLGATAALDYLRTIKSDAAPEAKRLADRIAALTGELATLQQDQGGWPWVPGRVGTPMNLPCDRMTSALAARALASARSVGLGPDPSVIDRAVRYLQGEVGKVAATDLEMRASIQRALSALGQGSFEAANALGRSRQALPDSALAELAVALIDLGRAPLANELIDVLLGRARAEAAGVGETPRTFWDGAGQSWARGPVETTAIVAEAIARVRPNSPDLAAAVAYLEAHRSGRGGWGPTKATGPALAALAKFHGPAGSADDRYRLVVLVNETEVYRADVDGGAEPRTIRVPRRAIKVGDRNRVRFDLEGRGAFGYDVALEGFARDFAPEQDRDGKAYTVEARTYRPAPPELDGLALPIGFSTVVNPTFFTNKATQVGLGSRAVVEVHTGRYPTATDPNGEREFLVVEETLPAGTTFIEGSLVSGAINQTLADGVLTLYFAPGTYPGSFSYEVFGYVPGQYRAAPTVIRSAYDPSRRHLGPAGDFKVLDPGATSTDPYKPSPDELHARGKALFESGRLAEAAGPLEEFSDGYTLRDDLIGPVARMLLSIAIRDYQPRKIVANFEILKEKAPDQTIRFDEIAVVARAYREIGEPERAYLVWRAILEASYLEDAQVGETIRQKGKALDAIAYLIDLWRESPGTPSIEGDFFGLSQTLASLAAKGLSDPSTRRELADASLGRPDLVAQAIRLNQTFLALSASSPLADEVSLAQVGDYLEVEDYKTVVTLAARYAAAYPRSKFLDSFQYSDALGRFNLGEYDRAIAIAETISKATYRDAAGIDRESPNKWQALFILGQIYDARMRPARAVEYYKLVADRFSDAASAIRDLTRKALKVPEVTLVRPGAKAGPTGPSGGFPRVETPSVAVDYRNIAEIDVKVYPVDLLRLYLTRRNLDAIAGIDLAGITPLHEATVKLGDGADFAEKVRSIDLPLTKEGAYLVMIRAENLYASGIVLVSPLEVEVLEEPDAGRVRVTVRDARTRAPAPKVSVKVIGSANPAFLSGETDLRGVFVADGVTGQVTAVARRDASQYAFHRGVTVVGRPVMPGMPAPPGTPAANPAGADLRENVLNLNYRNQSQQVERLQNRTNPGRTGIIIQEAR